MHSKFRVQLWDRGMSLHLSCALVVFWGMEPILQWRLGCLRLRTLHGFDGMAVGLHGT